MNNPILDVIQQAMQSHDDEAAHWLQKVRKLQQDPENSLHDKALALAQAYLEDLAAPGGAEGAGDEDRRASPGRKTG